MIERTSTLNMSREDWLKERDRSIGGSDAGSILGLNPYKSAYMLWAEKTGEIVPEDISDKEAVRLGNDLEEYVAQRFTEATGKKVHRCNAILRNSDYPFAHANPDRMVSGEDAGLECKTTSSRDILRRCQDGEFPETWLCQVTHYMMVTGAKRWYLAVLVFGQGFFWFTVERDEAEVAALAKVEQDFWKLVQDRTPPSVDGSASTREALNALFSSSDGTACDLTPVAGCLTVYRETKKQIAGLEAVLTEQQNKICSYMGLSDRGAFGSLKVTWKPQERRVFDVKSFQKDNPNMAIEQWYKVSTSRPFKVAEI